MWFLGSLQKERKHGESHAGGSSGSGLEGAQMRDESQNSIKYGAAECPIRWGHRFGRQPATLCHHLRHTTREYRIPQVHPSKTSLDLLHSWILLEQSSRWSYSPKSNSWHILIILSFDSLDFLLNHKDVYQISFFSNSLEHLNLTDFSVLFSTE